MDTVSVIRIISGVLFVVVLVILVQRRNRRADRRM